MGSIESTYEKVRLCVPPSIQLDSLQVVKQVEEYRQYWKPQGINVLLLGESHVYTNPEDFNLTCNKLMLSKMEPNYPDRFVRFVYCLYYGEREFLKNAKPDFNNNGTWQYWKIFSHCIGQDERRVQKSSSFAERINNKVELLRTMKRQGVWLLDTSIVGIYGNDIKTRDDGLQIIDKVYSICWDNYIEEIINISKPKHIIVIGKGMAESLSLKLDYLSSKLGIKYEILYQPQAILPKKIQDGNYQHFREICAKYL